MFITFEGGEGTGKSTQAKGLAARLDEAGRRNVLTREPGGSPGAEEIRSLLVIGGAERWSAVAEALLNYAARDSHLRETVRPALRRGDIVICDRYMDSTRAYQGHAGGCDLDFIAELERRIVGRDRPDLTLVFDLDPEIGLDRARDRGGDGGTRFEDKGLAFHRRLRDGFLAIARMEPERCRVIDAGRPVETIGAEVWETVSQRLSSASSPKGRNG